MIITILIEWCLYPCLKQPYDIFVTLDHKTSIKLLGYICSNSQKYIVSVKTIDFFFMPNQKSLGH